MNTFKTAFVGNCFCGFIGKPQELLGMSDSDLLQILINWNAELFFENPGKIILVDIKSCG